MEDKKLIRTLIIWLIVFIVFFTVIYLYFSSGSDIPTTVVIPDEIVEDVPITTNGDTNRTRNVIIIFVVFVLLAAYVAFVYLKSKNVRISDIFRPPKEANCKDIIHAFEENYAKKGIIKGEYDVFNILKISKDQLRWMHVNPKFLNSQSQKREFIAEIIFKDGIRAGQIWTVRVERETAIEDILNWDFIEKRCSLLAYIPGIYQAPISSTIVDRQEKLAEFAEVDPEISRAWAEAQHKSLLQEQKSNTGPSTLDSTPTIQQPVVLQQQAPYKPYPSYRKRQYRKPYYGGRNYGNY